MKDHRRRRKVDPQNQKESNAPETHSDVTRRRFLGTTAASSAVLLAGGLTSFFENSASAARKAATAASSAVSRLANDWIEKTIPQLQSLMASGQFTSRDLTHAYIQRLAELNPFIH